ncbi:MAG: hypothetical protein E7652_01340 [Ruminococcaceae bacterium]|nr:hypothetical protein [Oscillospiraceae bacterium]
MKRFLCLLLCLLLIPMIAACSTEAPEEDREEKRERRKDRDDDEAQEEVEEDDDNKDWGNPPKPSGSVVEDGLIFPNETFTVLCREDSAFGSYTYEITADEGSGDIVSQAVYERNRYVCDMFGLKEIKAVTKPGDWASQDIFINTFRNSIDAGLGEYDLIMGYQAYMANPELAQYFCNFYDVPCIKESLTNDYYYQELIKELTINGELKYMVGDYSLSYYDNAYAMYFNKDLAEQYALENIYQLVNDGKWTIDKCIEMSKGKWIDVNNDDWPYEEDSFGYITDIPNTVDAWAAHFDALPTQRDNDYISIGYDVSKVTSILEQMVDFFATDDVFSYHSVSTDTDNPLDTIFKEGRALFYHATLNKAADFRETDCDFGIVPYPKWSEAQEKYFTQSQSRYSVACIPIDVQSLEKSGAIFDVLSQLSYENVVPAYYDNALKYKFTRDDDSAEMLDIIRDGFILNFGVFYADTLNCANVFRNMVANQNTRFEVYYASNSRGWERSLDDLLSYYE